MNEFNPLEEYGRTQRRESLLNRTSRNGLITAVGAVAAFTGFEIADVPRSVESIGTTGAIIVGSYAIAVAGMAQLAKIYHRL